MTVLGYVLSLGFWGLRLRLQLTQSIISKMPEAMLESACSQIGDSLMLSMHQGISRQMFSPGPAVAQIGLAAQEVHKAADLMHLVHTLGLARHLFISKLYDDAATHMLFIINEQGIPVQTSKEHLVQVLMNPMLLSSLAPAEDHPGFT